MRSREEIQGIITAIDMAMQNDSVKLILKEAKNLKDSLLVTGYMATGEEAIRVLGVQQGIDLVIHLGDVMKAQNNVGNKGIIKP